MEQLKPETTLPTVEILEAIGAAFNRHDLDGIMAFFAEDGVFDMPGGPDIWGTRHTGKAAIRASFAELFEKIPDIHWEGTNNWVSGEMGCSQWRRTGTMADGTRFDCMGLDIFTFREGKVISKDSYFKDRG